MGHRTLRFLLGFLLLMLHLHVGRAITRWTGVPVPGSVVGMVLLFFTLRLGLVPIDVVRSPSDVLLRYMALFFVPPGVGLLLYFDLLAREWLPIATATVVSTLAVLCTVGWLQQRLEPGAVPGD